MKAISSILIGLLIVTSINSARSQTNIEEYNYLTKGYKIQLDAGLDMKIGYSFTDLGTYSTPQRSCTFKALMKQASKKRVAILCVFHAANKDTYYFCIPSDGSPNNIFEEYRKSLSILDNAEAARDYAFFVSLLGSKIK